jgi:hypothetical protein
MKSPHVLRALLTPAVVVALLCAPGAWRVRGHYRRRAVVVDGRQVGTVREAVAACRTSKLAGWALVEYAQRLVYARFDWYSTVNVWDTPVRAFSHGMGYCSQYNLALKAILDRLGVQAEAVSALRVRYADLDWRLGHTWLKVTVDGETRAVCAGRAMHRPGSVTFTPETRLLHGTPVVMLLHLGMIPFSGFLEWKALLTRTPPPEWTMQEFKGW